MDNKALAIVVGGGPAPGINGVIAAATIEARKRGLTVYGINTGFKRLMNGDKSCLRELFISDVSRIDREGGSVLGTSRANPKKSKEHLDTVVRLLEDHGVRYLVTIGGDDTAASAKAVAEAAGGRIAVSHVPKTIDNDLPLPGKSSTFGYQTAREIGTEIAETLMVDAKTTGRWYLVVAMGRKAGHLALGIGLSAGATLCVIPEEFGEKKVSLQAIVDIIVGSVLKRLVNDRPYGVAVLAEGLAEVLDQASIPELLDAERDPHGNIRFAEVDFGSLIKRAVRARLAELRIPDLLIVDKNVGYELRCHEPNSFDREYTRLLGYGAVNFLLEGGTEAMISRDKDAIIPIPFSEFIDPSTGRAQVRLVDTESVQYLVSRKYQIRLTEKNLADPVFMQKMSSLTGESIEQLREQFGSVAAKWGAHSR